MHNTNRIALLNDAFRHSFTGGRIFITNGIDTLHPDTKADILREVQIFDNFSEANDPYSEHDFGAFDINGAGKIFWKIDCYAPDMCHGSADSANVSLTSRVLTVMLAEEY